MSAILVLGFGIAVSSILAMWLQGVENAKEETIFQDEAYECLNALDNGLRNAIGFLSDLNQAFAESSNITQDQFRTFSRPLLERHAYIYSIAFHHHAGKKNRLGKRIRYTASPEIDGHAAVPLDASIIRNQELALSRSARTGHPAATALFRLPPSEESPPFLSVAATAYHQPAALETSPAVMPEAASYTIAVLNARNLAEEIFRQGGLLDKKGLEITLFESGNENSGKEIIFRNSGTGMKAQTRSNTLPFPPEEAMPGELRITRSYDVAGSRWHMVVSSKRSPPGISGTGPWMALIGGSLMSLLLAAYLQSLATRAKMLEFANKVQQDDIEARKSIERALLDTQGEMRELATYQDRMIENERKRIAREIHDDLGQNLLTLRIDVTLLDQQTATTHHKVNARVKTLQAQVDATIKSIRAIINHLRPAALDKGLCIAIEWLVQQMAGRSKVTFNLIVENKEFCRAFDDEQATAIFRIMQEALSNVVRHANARHAEIRLDKKDGTLYVVISDDGVGTYPDEKRKPRSFGLIGIRERVRAMGGEISIASEPNRGTTLSFCVPCRHSEKDADDEQLSRES